MCFSADVASLDETLLRWFDGTAAEGGGEGKGGEDRASDDDRAGFTLSLTTIDDQGWPRTALLGLAEVFAPDSAHLVLALWPASRSNHRLHARGRATLSFVLDGYFHEWRLVARRSAILADAEEAPLAYHLMALDGGDAHRVPYATLTSGIRYTLTDASATAARWRAQVRCMRRFAKGA